MIFIIIVTFLNVTCRQLSSRLSRKICPFDLFFTNKLHHHQNTQLIIIIMSSAIGFINVQLVIQNTLKFDLPLIYNLEKEHWMPNPKNGKRWTMPTWHVANFTIFILYTCCILYIPLLIRWAGSLSNVDPELLFTHSLLLILLSQALVTAHLFEWDPKKCMQLFSIYQNE